MRARLRDPLCLCCVVQAILALAALPGAAQLNLGPEGLVPAHGTDLTVREYSVPSYSDWDNDGLKDLIVGDGGKNLADPAVRVYLNGGTPGSPQFGDYVLAQSDGHDLTYNGSWCLPCSSTCMGLFPRVVYWDGDARKDLVVGQTDGTVVLYTNIGTDEAPSFDGGAPLQFGPPGAKSDVNVGGRATPTVVDWNSDGKKDLLVGSYDARIHVFINEGSDAAPDFAAETFVRVGHADLLVPGSRSSPVVYDLDGDGKKDLLTGNTAGQLLFYSNTGSDDAPNFTDYILVEAGGVPIDLPDQPRSRPFVCDWTGDGLLDVLIGAGDGKVHLYQGVPEPATLSVLCVGACLALVRGSGARRGRKS